MSFMQNKRLSHIPPSISSDGMIDWLEGWDDWARNSLGFERDGPYYSEDESIFVCAHLLTDPTVKVHQYMFREKDGQEIWRGDLLCENCMEWCIYELADEGLLVLLSYEEVEQAMMEGMDTRCFVLYIYLLTIMVEVSVCQSGFAGKSS